MGGFTFKIEGLSDALTAFDELAREIGDKKAQSKILVPAVRKAMQPVLKAAQRMAPVDTGALQLSLQVEARRPTKKDRRSKYVSSTDTVIAAVTTASGKKIKQMSEGKGLERSRKRLVKMGMQEKDASRFMGFTSDARAIAQEFGSAHNGAKPYLRPALESNAQLVSNELGKIIGEKIQQYRAKTK